MSRYLTPSKVGLLCLALVYADEVVPTSHIVPVLSFLISHIAPDTSSPANATSLVTDHVLKIEAFESALSPLASAIPGRTVWDLFLKRLWAIDCSSALEQLLVNALSVITKSREQLQHERDEGLPPEPCGRISRTSPLGAFIRRAHLEYTRLQFSDAAALWQKLIAYRKPTWPAFERKNATDGKSSLDVNLSDLQLDVSHPITQILYGGLADGQGGSDEFASTNDLQSLMEFQVSELQRFGGRLPEEMKIRLREMSQSRASIPSLGHYLKFIDSWRAGDYASAFDNLHRYFDYTMQSRDRAFYQYALLNLAILQADFGCYSEAIPAMREAISTARENKDVTCLNFCMSWLYHFGKAFPTEMRELRESGMLGSEHEALAFLKTKAKDAEMWSLLSTSLLSEAKAGLQNGESIATAFETIAKSAHLNVIKGVTSMQGPTLIVKGSVYARVGLASLTWSGGETFLECYADEVPAEDILKCTCRMANLLVQEGRYNAATEMMERVPEPILRVLKYRQHWTFSLGMLKLRRCLFRDELSMASRILSNLQGQGAPDIELSLAQSLLSIDFHVRSGSFDTALDQIEFLGQSSHLETSDVLVQIKLLNLKARILAQCGHPFQGFSITVRAANMAYRTRLLPCLWESITNLANILLHLDNFAAAVQILEAIAPQVLECQDSYLAASMYSLLADTYTGLAGQEQDDHHHHQHKDGAGDQKPSTPPPAKQLEHLTTANEHLDSALQYYSHIEDLSGQLTVLAKKATIMRVRGDNLLANDVASRYLDLKREYTGEGKSGSEAS